MKTLALVPRILATTAICCLAPDIVHASDSDFYAENCNRVAQVQQTLDKCSQIAVEFHFSKGPPNRILSQTETQEVIDILRQVAPLRYKGTTLARLRGVTYLVFSDKSGKKVGSLSMWSLTATPETEDSRSYRSLAEMSLAPEGLNRLYAIVYPDKNNR
ncbi:MAG: hypothetical protein IKT79_07055 [Akkermansia sp.]|nr:hypothetical protein [Akkermansia sp.]